MSEGPSAPLLTVRGLSRRFAPRPASLWTRGTDRPVHAVRDVSFHVRAGETLGIVGESGSGKTTVARLLLRLIEPTTGEIRLDGRDVLSLSPSEVRSHLRRRVRMIFQDPDAALNPAYPIGTGLARAVQLHGAVRPSDTRAAVLDLLGAVGMDESFLEKYPDELSGGEKRRLGVCRALVSDPVLIVADEPLSGLDVVLQERVLGVLKEAQVKRGFALILVSHDLDRVNQVCDRVLVMHSGRVVEETSLHRDGDRVTDPFRHPYSVMLQRARDAIGKAAVKGDGVDPEIPSGREPESGCSFSRGCPRRALLESPPACTSVVPALVSHATGHLIACHFADEVTT